MLWQAISSLALVHYVSEVDENKNVYSRLWSFGIRCLRYRECGLYEASDLLLGDHLCEKTYLCLIKEIVG